MSIVRIDEMTATVEPPAKQEAAKAPAAPQRPSLSELRRQMELIRERQLRLRTD